MTTKAAPIEEKIDLLTAKLECIGGIETTEPGHFKGGQLITTYTGNEGFTGRLISELRRVSELQPMKEGELTTRATMEMGVTVTKDIRFSNTNSGTDVTLACELKAFPYLMQAIESAKVEKAE